MPRRLAPAAQESLPLNRGNGLAEPEIPHVFPELILIRAASLATLSADPAFAARGLRARHRIYIHVNNTNPLLRDDSTERKETEAAGWEIAWDGMEMTL